MIRRTFLAGSTATALATWAGPLSATPEDWRQTVGELRCGGLLASRAHANALATALGVPVRPIRLESPALIAAFHAGQIEFGRFDATLFRPIQAVMGDRVISPLPGVLMLRSLPLALRSDVIKALAQA